MQDCVYIYVRGCRDAGVFFAKCSKPLVLCKVEVAFDIQQHLPDEAQPPLFKLLALIEHLLHVFHVLWGALTQLIQSLLILFLGLGCKKRQTTNTLCNLERQPL